ncbi:hypothetical protein [Nocardioides sp. YIM 152315]|uniref:hypothetical protein n=1 Tax=Nocardioides sp. YIM 152315 TaxID=3031760 RepID=UPI0023DAF9DC|nr:hypothetical protein [Nocardioides sp. YIM 152315]MDF1603877.1 hypothetical protein [Nocardioides sp. YIM 152315]
MDDAAWAALTLSLTVLGGIWTWAAFRRRGFTSGLRALGFTLLPLAAYLTETLQMFTRIADAVTDWATRLVFSPTVWLGVIVGGVGITLIVVSGMMRARQLGKAPAKGGSADELPAGRAPRQTAAAEADPEMAEIEALLRKRGIS